MKILKALVLGGNGFIGSHLTDRLLSEGHSVRVFDRFRERFREPLPNVDYRIAQFSDSFAIAEALEGIDIVYHLISTTVPGTSNLNPAADINDNLIMTVGLLEQMIKAGVKRILYFSSGGTVYGNPEKLPVPEDHPLNPICSYGIVKLTVEKYLFMYKHLFGLKPVVVRPSNPYGPRQGHIGVQGLIATFIHKIINGETIKIWGDGLITRDYLYIDDLVRLCVIAGSSDYTGIFNVGSGQGYSILSIIDILANIVGKKPDVIHEPIRSFDVREVVLDITRAKEKFGWDPEISLEDGIKKYWLWTRP